MKRKPKEPSKDVPASPPPPGTLVIEVHATDDPIVMAKRTAAALLRPNVRAGITLSHWRTKFLDCGITEIVGELRKQGEIASGGNLSRLEEMLAIQAHVTDAVFYEYARLARVNLFEHPDASESFMRLGLKAQSQCRATIETLAAIKNPPNVAFVKQANIANGHQQVNNGEPRARENPFPSNEVLESHERLEHREAQTAGFGDPTVATVGTVNRTEDGNGQGSLEPEQSKARR